MTETIKLYDEKPYETSFAARVLSVTAGKKADTLDIILDRTLFFPEEGGQTPDRGLLAGLPVTDVKIKAGIITHTVSAVSSVPEEGSEITGQIDWEHRYSNMQNHTGEHILSGILHNIYGYENVGFRLSDNTVTLDTSGQLDDAQILDLEMRANAVVWQNAAVRCEYPDKETLNALSYRSKIEIEGAVRIVTIDGVDVCACCAPHVARTGEVGLIKIIDVLHNKKDMRLTIVCGKRALEEMQKRQEQIVSVSRLVSLPPDRIFDGVKRLQDETKALKEEVFLAEMSRVEQLTAMLTSQKGNAPDIWYFDRKFSPQAQRELMNRLCETDVRYAGVFVGNDEEGYKYLIGGRGADARAAGQLLKEKLSARGGGKPDMVQGSAAASQEAILSALSEL